MRSLFPVLGPVLAASVAIGGISVAQTPGDEAPLGQEGEWQLVFGDDFDGVALDTSKWTTCYWWDKNGCTNLGNNELQWYMPANVTIADGALQLTARPEEVAGIDGRTFSYTSGMVTTGRSYEERRLPDRFSMQQGYVEIRARIPAGSGLWPALWLLPSDHESIPEIDIMEVLGHRPDVLEMHFHYRDSEGKNRSAGSETTHGDLSKDWHVYGLEWGPDALIWYLDGVEQWRFDERAFIPKEPMYLLLNLAVGGDWPGDPDGETVFPARYLVDYVRVWQRAAQ